MHVCKSLQNKASGANSSPSFDFGTKKSQGDVFPVSESQPKPSNAELTPPQSAVANNVNPTSTSKSQRYTQFLLFNFHHVNYSPNF